MLGFCELKLRVLVLYCSDIVAILYSLLALILNFCLLLIIVPYSYVFRLQLHVTVLHCSADIVVLIFVYHQYPPRLTNAIRGLRKLSL